MNPKVHAGFHTSVNFEYDRQTSKTCLYPLEIATAKSSFCVGEYLDDHLIMGRVCALPIALSDTCCPIPVLTIDTVWSVAGTFFSGITALGTGCCWDTARHATKDFACATVSNICGICFNLFAGPVFCTFGTIAACKSSEQKCKIFWCSLPHVVMCFPLTCGYGVLNICKDPRATGEKMKERLSMDYDI